MPETLALEIIEHVSKNQKEIYKDLVDAMAKIRRTRRPVILEMPRSTRHPEMLAILQNTPAIEVAFQILTAWLLDTQQPMLTAFLEAVGIPHDGDGCADEFPETEPDTALLQSALDTLLKDYPADKATVYLHAFNAMPETCWESLDALLGQDPRLAFAKAKA